MSTKLEELEKRWEKEKELLAHLDRYCDNTRCSECVLNENQTRCEKSKIVECIEDLELEIRNERNRVKTIEDAMKTREEMTKAMLSVKRDDWDIVNIAYAEDDTTAVAFIKKGTELKPNMEPVQEKTNRACLFEAAREASKKDVCTGVRCSTCPMFITQTNDAHACIKPLVRKRLNELGEGENDNA